MNNLIYKKKINALIHSIGIKNNLTDDLIKEIVESPFLFTYLTLKEVDYEGVETKEQLEKLKTNFMYKSLGKLVVSDKLYLRRLAQIETGKLLNKRKWEKK